MKADGAIVAWGNNASGQCNIPIGLSNVVSISAGGSYSAVLTKAPGQVIAPQGQTVNAGGYATFSFLASGYQPMTYQWQLNGANISGATNATLNLTNLPLTSAGTYQCVASNGFGTAFSTPAPLAVLGRLFAGAVRGSISRCS